MLVISLVFRPDVNVLLHNPPNNADAGSVVGSIIYKYLDVSANAILFNVFIKAKVLNV